MRYVVKGIEFPYDRRGIDAAIKEAMAYAFDGPVQIMKVYDDGIEEPINYVVPQQEPKQREGHVDVAPEHRKKFGA